MSRDTHRGKPVAPARGPNRAVPASTNAVGERRQAARRCAVENPQLLHASCGANEPRWPVRLLATLVVLCIALAGFVWWNLLSALP